MSPIIVMIRFLLLACLALASPIAAKTILAFGDSWAWLGYNQFEQVFGKHNVSTSLHAIPGTPAGYWALVQPRALVRAIDDAGADAVYLSIGGNDFLEGLPVGHLVPALFAEMMASTQAIIDRVFAERPHVQVFHFGYELLNWASDPLCKALGLLELFGPPPDLCPDVANVTCMTRAQATWLQEKFIDKGLGQVYRDNPNYVPLNLLGTLQAAGGVAGAKIGAPVWSSFSPAKYVRSGAEVLGCVHLTPQGFTVLYEELARRVLPHLERPRPAAPPSARDAAERLPDLELTGEQAESSVAAHAVQKPCRSDKARRCWIVAGGGASF